MKIKKVQHFLDSKLERLKLLPTSEDLAQAYIINIASPKLKNLYFCSTASL